MHALFGKQSEASQSLILPLCRWSGWGLERPRPRVSPSGLASIRLSGQVPQHDAAAAPQGRWSGAHVWRHLPGELCSCALLAGMSPGEQMVAAVGPSFWSQEETLSYLLPLFSQDYKWYNRHIGDNREHMAGWAGRSTKKPQLYNTASKTNYFVYPMNISLLHTAALWCLNTWR